MIVEHEKWKRTGNQRDDCGEVDDSSMKSLYDGLWCVDDDQLCDKPYMMY